MSVQDIVLAGGGGAFVLLTLLQIAPIKINPWSAIAKTVGRAINAEVLKELDEMKSVQKDTRERLERHIEVDNERGQQTGLHFAVQHGACAKPPPHKRGLH